MCNVYISGCVPAYIMCLFITRGFSKIEVYRSYLRPSDKNFLGEGIDICYFVYAFPVLLMLLAEPAAFKCLSAAMQTLSIKQMSCF